MSPTKTITTSNNNNNNNNNDNNIDYEEIKKLTSTNQDTLEHY